MLVIGIDPGTASTGYGLIRQLPNGQLELINYGLISTKSGVPMASRLMRLFSELTTVLAEFNPEAAAIEKLYFQRNVSTAISVGQARGVAMLAFAQAGIEIEEYSPNEIKLAVSGYGGADKRQVQAMVKTLLSMKEEPKPDDAADALAVAICHCHSSKMRNIRGQQ
jgi:crossover junction endodeoxyribonuclease RuvC